MVIKNQNRIGVVAQVFPERCAARVNFEDVELLSAVLHVNVRRAIGTKDFWMPEVGEDVLCMFVDDNTGFILGSWYADDDALPCDIKPGRSDDIIAVEFNNGSKIICDTKKNQITIDGNGDFNITLLDNLLVHMPINKNISIFKDLPPEVD